ncbi:hypothetical protein U1Q18_012812 [Sarracenia purpurea var. burkii]
MWVVSSGVVNGVRIMEVGEPISRTANRRKGVDMGNRAIERNSSVVSIPQMRQSANSIFGFVKFSVDDAVYKVLRIYNGVCCLNKRFVVKNA